MFISYLRKTGLGLAFYFVAGSLAAQTINGYAKVTSIASGTLTLSNVNETADSFEDGEYIVIMQMQDDVIGSNTLDNSSFGDLSSIQNAGRYEIRQIASHTETAGVPTTITISGSLVNTYNTGANSSVQIITFRLMSATNFTTTSNMSAMNWDGNVGGVIAFEVGGTLTLAHSISANGAGFRGGTRSANYYIGGTACYTTPFRSSSTNDADKGEGIYKITDANYLRSRAKVLNGGGGGIQINTGGGGGGNFTSGGIGGPGWNGTAGGCAVGSGGYGYGGIALGSFVSGNRIFMGGGGGGGQQNNTASTSGGNGGGIVLIKANAIATTGTCGSISISANGVSPGLAGNDGAGGGGAAGSIVLQVNSYSIASGCTLNITANGGNGGSINTSTHAGGGGGAQGVVIFSGAQPTTNVNTTTNNGTAGCNNNSSPCNNLAGSPSGTNNSGILTNTSNPLPIELLSFNATLFHHNAVSISWITSSEINNNYFTVLKSTDGLHWQPMEKIDGAGTSSGYRSYEVWDLKPVKGYNYYSLKQTDFDGTSVTYGPVAVELISNPESVLLFPNPAQDFVTITCNTEFSRVMVKDLQGKLVLNETLPSSLLSVTLNLNEVETGVYTIEAVDAYLRPVAKNKLVIVKNQR